MKYQEQLELARAKYSNHPEGKGMGYLANLELGNWLTQAFDWDWYVTLTFAEEGIGIGRANGSWQCWLNSVNLMAKANAIPRPHYVRATELQANRYTPTIHYHALVGGVAALDMRLADDMWRAFNGLTRVEKYKPELGAGFYLGKYLVKGDSDIRFSHNLKRRNKVVTGELGG